LHEAEPLSIEEKEKVMFLATLALLVNFLVAAPTGSLAGPGSGGEAQVFDGGGAHPPKG
jgi:hypothetical protein